MGYAHGKRFHDEIHHVHRRARPPLQFTRMDGPRTFARRRHRPRRSLRRRASSLRARPHGRIAGHRRRHRIDAGRAGHQQRIHRLHRYDLQLGRHHRARRRRADFGRRQLHRLHGPAAAAARTGERLLRPDLGYARFGHALRHPDSRRAGRWSRASSPSPSPAASA